MLVKLNRDDRLPSTCPFHDGQMHAFLPWLALLAALCTRLEPCTFVSDVVNTARATGKLGASPSLGQAHCCTSPQRTGSGHDGAAMHLRSWHRACQLPLALLPPITLWPNDPPPSLLSRLGQGCGLRMGPPSSVMACLLPCRKAREHLRFHAPKRDGCRVSRIPQEAPVWQHCCSVADAVCM